MLALILLFSTALANMRVRTVSEHMLRSLHSYVGVSLQITVVGNAFDQLQYW